MEFWGVEVKSGEPLKVSPGDGMVLHLSQACIGELKKEKGNEAVYLFVNVDGTKLVLGTLFADKLPQQQFDLVFDKDFELSHNFKSASVYFYGYRASNPFEEYPLHTFSSFGFVFLNCVFLLIRTGPEGESDEFDSEEEEEEEEEPLPLANNGKPESKPKEGKSVEVAKANADKGKESDGGRQKVKIVEPKKDVDASEEDDESSDEDMMSEDDDEDDSQDEDDSDESGESDEETPKKAEPSKKRPSESATKTPVQSKKAKATPQKTDGKKAGGHVATPHPAKQAGKTPANKPNQQTTKSGGSHSCKSCNRTFTSEQGLDSHTKAKHAGGK
ncbi:histone deacetylase HDT1 [Striga asiatica]|uniref:Histone deacetylase HDT1 n=1 Tax=Striga asiatica TaxID=4170 RepID=A0A5A7QJT9_STRAF|nr:histone deacetylase HDT1 [Striga asiatica]